MPRYCFEIEAGDDFPDRFGAELADREAAYAYAIELASARLQEQASLDLSMVVRITIKDDRGELVSTLRSIAG